MKSYFIGLVAAALLCGACPAQETTTPQPSNTPTQQTGEGSAAPAQPQEQRLAIAPGSVIPVRLSEAVDAKKAKTGDEVEAKVTQDLKSVNGEVVMPKDTKVIGHIIDAQVRSKEQKESQVEIAFDHAAMKDGTIASLPMSIQAVIAPPSQDSSDNGGGPSQSAAPSSMGGMAPGNVSGRTGGMSAGAQQSPSSMSQGEATNSDAGASSQRPAITANTQGVVGISNYKLSTTGDDAMGSVISSEKGNVKLESGTVMLLRVNQ
jgi:hypothetical protein